MIQNNSHKWNTRQGNNIAPSAVSLDRLTAQERKLAYSATVDARNKTADMPPDQLETLLKLVREDIARNAGREQWLAARLIELGIHSEGQL
jgi:hypothetical protein